MVKQHIGIITLALIAAPLLFGANEKASLLPKEKSKEEIIKKVKAAELMVHLNDANKEEVVKELQDYKIFRIFAVYHSKSTEKFLTLAARARIENWGKPYIDAIDELLEESKQICTVQ